MMLIYVHSAGRAELGLPTLEALLKTDYAGSVRLVVQTREAKAYAGMVTARQFVVLPPKIKTLSPTRQWILDNCPTKKFLLMDDDLDFAVRRSDDHTKFRTCESDDLDVFIAATEEYLDSYAHVGWMAREGANRTPTNATNVRMMRVLGYHAPKVRKAGARFDRLPTKQDFDMTLQLLRAGHDNLVVAGIVHNQKGSNTAGGCSTYRTPKMMDDSAHALVKLHPGFVKVVQKETKSAWGGGVRTDVQIAWKKARASAVEKCYEAV